MNHDYNFDRLLRYAVKRLKNHLPLPLDVEAALVSRGYDIEALRQSFEDDNDIGFSFADEAA